MSAIKKDDHRKEAQNKNNKFYKRYQLKKFKNSKKYVKN